MIQLAKEDDEEKNSSELNRFFVSHFFVKDPISKKKLRLAQQIREKNISFATSSIFFMMNNIVEVKS